MTDVGVARFITVASIPVYATLAFRGAYGGSLARTMTKEVAIGLISAIAFVTMI